MSNGQLMYRGSSPRAWGTHRHRRGHQSRRRFIPTCVGNTFILQCAAAFYSVHPHVRGEHGGIVSTISRSSGSSPRAWGTPVAVRFDRRHQRFIPTCVGNTTRSTPPPAFTPVHPHVRGEHVPSASLRRPVSGSSPRAWGTLAVVQVHLVQRRFIPTCVGNTLQRPQAQADSPVHPHVRGEHATPAAAIAAYYGSSPRAWGTLSKRIACRVPHRFIPTCVGNTCILATGTFTQTVHPHVRGEHGSSSLVRRSVDGSSPRAWGTRCSRRLRRRGIRFIPTCVGNTPCALPGGG